MSEDIAALEAAVARIATTEDVSMRPDWLAVDLRAMREIYGDGFEAAVDSLARALSDVIAKRVSTAALKYELEHVRSYHFQSRKAQGAKADMRLAFVAAASGIEVISLGNRFEPQDFYKHASARVGEGD